jgi:hypothetical protein
MTFELQHVFILAPALHPLLSTALSILLPVSYEDLES